MYWRGWIWCPLSSQEANKSYFHRNTNCHSPKFKFQMANLDVHPKAMKDSPASTATEDSVTAPNTALHTSSGTPIATSPTLAPLAPNPKCWVKLMWNPQHQLHFNHLERYFHSQVEMMKWNQQQLKDNMDEIIKLPSPTAPDILSPVPQPSVLQAHPLQWAISPEDSFVESLSCWLTFYYRGV